MSTTMDQYHRRLIHHANIATSLLDVGAGSATVLVHGTGSNAVMGWGAVLPDLSRSHRLLVPDLLGSGLTSGNVEPYTLERLVAQVLSVAAEADNEPINLVGYSLGAVVSACAAAELGAQVEKLVLIGGWAASDARMGLLFRLWQGLADTDRLQLARHLVLDGLSDGFLDRAGTPAISELVEGFRDGLAPQVGEQAALDARIDISNRLDQISARTLVIGLTNDRICPVAHARQLADGIANSTYEEIDSGHLVMIETPGQVRDMLERHLS